MTASLHKPQKTLFISRDGQHQPYLESLFIPVLAGLDRSRVAPEILEFCLPEVGRASKRAADRHDVPLHTRRYHGSILGSILDTLIAVVVIHRFIRARGVTVLHPRSHVPGIAVLVVKIVHPTIRIVFDADGLMPDERREARGWSERAVVYRALRWIEAKLVTRADAVVVRTPQTAEILRSRTYPRVPANRFYVIPNGKDSTTFMPSSSSARMRVRRELGIDPQAFLVLYVGSIGPNYLPREMFRFFVALRARRPNAHFLMITTDDRESLVRDAVRAGVPEAALTVTTRSHEAMPPLIAAADIGLSFRQAGVSRAAVCPLKVAEYLLCGVPVVTNEGVGDLDAVFQSGAVGYLLREFDDRSLTDAVAYCVENCAGTGREAVRRGARRAGLAYFDLRRVQERYDRVYRSLGSSAC
ncbi:MAG: glycosyltransferase [Candidatus Paceibacterota bacterium]